MFSIGVEKNERIPKYFNFESFSNSTFLRFLHSENAQLSIKVTFLGTIICSIDEFLKANLPIYSNFEFSSN